MLILLVLLFLLLFVVHCICFGKGSSVLGWIDWHRKVQTIGKFEFQMNETIRLGFLGEGTQMKRNE